MQERKRPVPWRISGKRSLRNPEKFECGSFGRVCTVSQCTDILACPPFEVDLSLLSYKKCGKTSSLLSPSNRAHIVYLPVSNETEMTVPVKEAISRLENKRVKLIRPLIPPQILQEDLPLFVDPIYRDRLYAH